MPINTPDGPVSVPIPPAPITQLIPELDKLISSTRWQAAATLASSIIAASGKPYSIAQAMEITKNIYFSMFPEPGSSIWQDWNKNKDAKLNKVHSV